MTKTRRKFTAEQKAAIVRRHLKDKEPISSIAAELSIQPTQIHQWVALALEQVERVFEKSANSERAYSDALKIVHFSGLRGRFLRSYFFLRNSLRARRLAA